MREVDRRTSRLRCELTSEERLAKCELYRAENDTFEAEKKAFAAKSAAHKIGQRARLDAMANGYEFRDVEVQVLVDEEQAIVKHVRLDTGEIIVHRPMNAAERQGSLHLVS